jgi:hypothetical protein
MQVDIQIHLEDPKCVAELRRVVRQTLRRAARTWAPLPLPVDRVVVAIGHPSSGKVDVYDHFPESADQNSGRTRRLVVISLGLRDGERELEAAEVAGALAARIQAVVDDRYRGTKAVVTADSVAPARVAPPTTPTTPTGITRQVRSAVPAEPIAPAVGGPMTKSEISNADLPRLQDLLAAQQKDQPLVAAGPQSNGIHP